MCNGDNFNTQGRNFIKLHLKSGKNNIKFSNPNDAAPDLDKIEIVKSGELLGHIKNYNVLSKQLILKESLISNKLEEIIKDEEDKDDFFIDSIIKNKNK